MAWVTGYPITDQVIDLMEENEREKVWAELNAPDPYADALKEAAKDLAGVVSTLNVVIDHLCDASSVLSGTPVQKKVDSFVETVEDIKYDIWGMKMRWEEGQQ